MLRRLIVLRHAKSAWDTDAPSDHARPLNKRGRGDLPLVARLLEAMEADLPELVICSPAQRARETATGVLQALGSQLEIHFEESLYKFYFYQQLF